MDNNDENIQRSADSSSPQDAKPNDKNFANVDEKTKSVPRRSRARRNPVWQYFCVENGVASCTNCDYNTKSVYSTNLKVHLKSHHSQLYDLVRKAEEAIDVGSFPNGNSKIFLNQEVQSPSIKDESTPPMTNDSNSDGESNFVEGKTPGSRSSTHEGMSSTSPQPNNGIDSKTPTLDSILSVPTLFFGGSDANVTADFTSANFDNIFRNTSNYFTQSVDTDLGNNNNNTSLGDAIANFVNLPLNPLPTTSSHQSLDFLSKNLPNLFNNANSTYNNESNVGIVARPLSIDENNFGLNGEILADGFRTKRKRLRRHPVWRFFKDVEDKTVGCVTCNFKTRSAFSTNLKMHLRAHHKEQYLMVMEMELEQCNLENTISTNGNGGSTSAEFEALPGGEFPSPNCQFAGRLKRKRKSVEEIQCIINKCKVGLAKERQRRSSSDLGANGVIANQHNNVQVPFGTNSVANADVSNNRENTNSMLSAMAILQALQAQKPKPPPAESSNLSSGFSSQQTPPAQPVKKIGANTSTLEQLNTMIGLILRSRNAANAVADGGPNTNCDNNNNNDDVDFKHQQEHQEFKHQQAEAPQQFLSDLPSNGDNGCDSFSSARSSPMESLANAANFASKTSTSQLDEIRRLFDFCKTTDSQNDKLLRSVVLKQAMDLTFVKLVEALGSPNILSVPAFRLLISVISPDYDWSSIDREQAATRRE